MNSSAPGYSTAMAIVLLTASGCVFFADAAYATPGWSTSADGTRTVEIDIEHKQYVPPDQTLVIPPEYKEKGYRFAVRSGDRIKICNHDSLIMKPFVVKPDDRKPGSSLFENLTEQGGLHQGQCLSFVVNHRANDIARLNLHDEVHARNKLAIIVVPQNYPNTSEPTPPIPKAQTEEYTDLPQVGDVGEMSCDWAIPGSWSWGWGTPIVVHGTVVFRHDGRMVYNGRKEGSWSCQGEQATLTWDDGKSVDRMTIAGQGHTLVGSNGTVNVQGTR